MSMIIGKRQIILAALVVALGTAIFLNWKFTGSNGGSNVAGVFNTSSALGTSTYVSASGSTSGAGSTASGKSSAASGQNSTASASGSGLFAQERLTRTKTRAEAEQALQITLNSSTATDAQKQAAQTQISSIANNITAEGNVESLIISKGFKDCVCFINNGTVSVVVAPKSNQPLSASDSAQIADIVIQQTKVSADNIHIIQSK